MPRPRYAARSGDYWPGEKGLAILAMLGRKTERRAPQALPRQPNRERTPKVATRRPTWPPWVRLEPSAGGRADGSGGNKTSCLSDSRPLSLSAYVAVNSSGERGSAIRAGTLCFVPRLRRLLLGWNWRGLGRGGFCRDISGQLLAIKPEMLFYSLHHAFMLSEIRLGQQS